MTVALQAHAAPTPVRTVYLPDLAPARTDLALIDPTIAIATARRQEMKARILQDKARRDSLHAQDVKVKRFWVGFGAVVGFAVVVVAAAVTWWAYAQVGSVGLLVLPATFLAGVVTVFLFHRCVFTLHHGHR